MLCFWTDNLVNGLKHWLKFSDSESLTSRLIFFSKCVLLERDNESQVMVTVFFLLVHSSQIRYDVKL